LARGYWLSDFITGEIEWLTNRLWMRKRMSQA
jgi:hypothetical protein